MTFEALQSHADQKKKKARDFEVMRKGKMVFCMIFIEIFVMLYSKMLLAHVCLNW